MTETLEQRDAQREREKILAQRQAFIAGVEFRDLYCPCNERRVTGPEAEAKARYPLPRMLRPRVVKDPEFQHCEWRVCGGELSAGAYGQLFTPTPARVAMWADLLANPTELVDAE